MLYRTEFTYGAKIVERGMKVLDAINTQKKMEKQGLKRKVLINKKTATSWGASLNLRKFSNERESINQSLKVLRKLADSICPKRIVRIIESKCDRTRENVP